MKQFRKTSLVLCVLCFLSLLSLHAGEERRVKKKYDYGLSATAIFCNEAPYLQEWIEYHKLIGVEHFYLYNNLSTDNYSEQLASYIKNGEIDLIEWPYKPSNWGEWDQIQIDAYRNAIQLSKNKTKWLAIIDLDEFIVPVKRNNLAKFLTHYENSSIGGVCLIWSFFGTSNVENIPKDKLLIETLVLNSGPAAGGDVSNIWNQGAYKSIVRPEFISLLGSPHYCTYIEGRHHQMVEYNQCHINHYWTRDQDYLLHFKIPRREAWGQSADSTLSWAAGMNGCKDNNPILKFIPKLRTRMGL